MASFLIWNQIDTTFPFLTIMISSFYVGSLNGSLTKPPHSPHPQEEDEEDIYAEQLRKLQQQVTRDRPHSQEGPPKVVYAQPVASGLIQKRRRNTSECFTNRVTSVLLYTI